MKQRLTYLLPAGTEFGSSDIQIVDDGLDFTKADQASEEWRITLDYNELPDDLQVTLASFQEVHVRLVSPRNAQSVHPLYSRLPPGLHIFLTTTDDDRVIPLYSVLDAIIQGKAAARFNVEDTCSWLPLVSEHSPGISAYQFYQYSSIDNTNIGKTFLSGICESSSAGSYSSLACKNLRSDIADASHVDIDFDVRLNTVTLTSLWTANAVEPEDEDMRSSRREYTKLGPQDKLEVGVLRKEIARRSEELSVGGYLTVVGENDHPSPTLFSFPSRHRPPPDPSTTFIASFQQPTGLHPKLQISLPRRHLVPPKDTCSLHAYMTNPSTLFIDSYQLSDDLFLESQNLIALKSLSGEVDLEAPDWVTKRWGSAALLQLAVPKPSDSSAHIEEDWPVTIPMHLRYVGGGSTGASNEATVEIPWPVVFWTCEADDGGDMSTNPFDRTHLGYDALFGPRTIFYHIPPASNVTETVLEINVPVLSRDSGMVAQIGTLVAVALGFGWVCWQLLKVTQTKSGPREKGRKRK